MEVFMQREDKNALNEELIRKWLLAQKRMLQTSYYIGRLSTKEYWQEIAGTFVMSPRQTGKTTALNNLIKYIKASKPEERIVVVASHDVTLKKITRDADIKLISQTGTSWLHATNPRSDHLLVDEFMYLESGSLDTLLDLEWKSVTMIGSMNNV